MSKSVAGVDRCIIALEPDVLAYDLPPLTRLCEVLLHREQLECAFVVPIVAPLPQMLQWAAGAALAVSMRGGALQLSRAPRPGELCLEVHYEAWRWVSYRMAYFIGDAGS